MSTLRKLARGVAKANLKKMGARKVCHRYGLRDTARSWFSDNWRDYIHVAARGRRVSVAKRHTEHERGMA